MKMREISDKIIFAICCILCCHRQLKLWLTNFYLAMSQWKNKMSSKNHSWSLCPKILKANFVSLVVPSLRLRLSFIIVPDHIGECMYIKYPLKNRKNYLIMSYRHSVKTGKSDQCSRL